MKKLMFASLALFASAVAVNAQETPAPAPAPSSAAVSVEQDEKIKIKSEELPETVKKSLEAQEYKGWLINAAYHDKKAGTYEVELKNGAETKAVKFDKEGKKLD